MTTLIERAKEFAFAAHNAIDQHRKFTGEPYVVHIERVAKLVASVVHDERMIAAAYLHDTVEDTTVTFDDIAEHFGADVAYIVIYLTSVSRPKDGNRATRKEVDRRHIARGDARVHTVKLADLIDNVGAIAAADAKFAAVYMEEKRLLLPVLADGHPVLFEEATRLIKQWFDGK